MGTILGSTVADMGRLTAAVAAGEAMGTCLGRKGQEITSQVPLHRVTILNKESCETRGQEPVTQGPETRRAPTSQKKVTELY